MRRSTCVTGQYPLLPPPPPPFIGQCLCLDVVNGGSKTPHSLLLLLSSLIKQRRRDRQVEGTVSASAVCERCKAGQIVTPHYLTHRPSQSSPPYVEVSRLGAEFPHLRQYWATVKLRCFKSTQAFSHAWLGGLNNSRRGDFITYRLLSLCPKSAEAWILFVRSSLDVVVLSELSPQLDICFLYVINF